MLLMALDCDNALNFLVVSILNKRKSTSKSYKHKMTFVSVEGINRMGPSKASCHKATVPGCPDCGWYSIVQEASGRKALKKDADKPSAKGAAAAAKPHAARARPAKKAHRSPARQRKAS